MARRQTQSVPAVSLFPFLAVLVCAMGSLILLLLVISRHVRPPAPALPTLAEAKPDEVYSDPLPQFPPVPKLEDLVPERTPEIAVEASQPIYSDAPGYDPSLHARPEVIASRQSQSQQEEVHAAQLRQLTSQLEQVRAEQAELQRLREQRMAQLQQIQAEQTAMQTEEQQAKQSLASLRDQIAAIEAELKQKKEEAANLQANQTERQDKLEIVAYDGPTGVKRQPIFIECRGGEVIFHPEKISLSTLDLEQIPPQCSPIAYAVRALADYRRQGQPDYQAYVLMVGRPNGIEEFYGCGQSLTGHRIPFGYELIGQDRELYLGKPDPIARQIILDAIEQARTDARAEPTRFQKMHTLAERAKLRGFGGPEETGTSAGQGSTSAANMSRNERGGSMPGSPRTSPMGGGSPGRFPAPEQASRIPGGGSSVEQRTARSTATGKFPASGQQSAGNEMTSRGSGSSSQTTSEGTPETASNSGGSGWQRSESLSPNFTEADPLEALKQGSGQNSSHGPTGPGGIGRAGQSNGAIRLERPIRIRVFAEGAQVAKRDFVASSDTQPADVIRGPLLDQLRAEIGSWGAAPEGIEWRPTIQLEVAPGGNRLAFRIEDWMQEFHLDTKSVPIVAKSPAAETLFFE